MATRPAALPRAVLFTRYWLPVLVYLALIQVVSAQPDFQVPALFPNIDKAVHVIEYLGLGILLTRAFRAGWPERAPLYSAMVTFLLGVFVGAADEFLQQFTPGRMSSVNDLLADATGLLLAQLVLLLVVRE